MIRTPYWFVLEKNQRNYAPDSNEYFFEQALVMAQSCMGLTHPNPNVGAVIVKDGRIIASGATKKAGCDHAEIVALTNARAKALGADLFVTLEPCSHFGKTPPCTTAIIKAGIKRVVFGVEDPNPQVCGRGVQALKNAGIVVEQIKDQDLCDYAQTLNVPFKKFILEKRPYVVAKIASTKDLAIATSSGPLKITGAPADEVVHRLRRAHDAILVGANTAKIDNPRLSAREKNPAHDSQPCRIILSSDLSLPLDLQIFSEKAQAVYVVTTEASDRDRAQKLQALGVKIIQAKKSGNRLDLNDVFHQLGKLGLTSVLIEPGARLLTSLLAQDLIDELWWLKSPEQFSGSALRVKGLADHLAKSFTSVYQGVIGRDSLHLFGRNKQ